MMRRQFLLRVGQLALGATGVAACGSSDAGGAGDASPTTTASAPETSSPGTAGATSSTAVPASATAPTTRGPAPWAGADFNSLDQYLADVSTDAFLIVERSVAIHQWARPGTSPVRDIASAQKSVLALLIGRAVADGHFTLDTVIDDVLGSTWTPHGQTAGITVHHLLTMTSGLDDSYAVVAPPGTKWVYSAAFATLFDLLTTTTGLELGDIAGEWLFGPAGATTARFHRRAAGDFAPVGLIAGVADLAAIGQTVLARTQPGLPPTWLDDCLSPSQRLNLSYGYLWWLNGQPTYILPGQQRPPFPGPLIDNGPADLVAALGKDDQKLYISRELELVVARLGGKADTSGAAARSSFDADLWQRLVTLRSA